MGYRIDQVLMDYLFLPHHLGFSFPENNEEKKQLLSYTKVCCDFLTIGFIHFENPQRSTYDQIIN